MLVLVRIDTLNERKKKLLSMAAAAATGAASIGPTSLSSLATVGAESNSTASSVHIPVYYVPLDVRTMREIYEFYKRNEPLVRRANSIRSHASFGSGMYLEYGEAVEISPNDGYDYRLTLQDKLERAREFYDMFGFVAYVNRSRAIEREYETATGSALDTSRTGAANSSAAEKKVSDALQSIEKVTGPLIVSAAPAPAPAGQPQSTVIAPDTGSAETSGVPAGIDAASSGSGPEKKKRPASIVEKAAARKPEPAKTQKKRKKEPAIAAPADEKMDMVDLLLTIEAVAIVDFEQGYFYLEIDDAYRSQRIVWVPYWRAPGAAAGNGGPMTDHAAIAAGPGGGRLKSVNYDPEVSVFVWPGRMPTRDGRIISDFLEVIRMRSLLREAEENFMDADYQSAHPVTFVYQGKHDTKSDITQLTEDEIYGGDEIARNMLAPDSMTTGERQTYKRDVRTSVLNEIAVEQYNSSMLQGSVNRFASAQRSVPLANGTNGVAMRRHVLEKTGIFLLPGGLEPGSTVAGTSIAPVADIRDSYEHRLCVALGVPLHFMRGTGGMRSAASASSSSNRSAPATGPLLDSSLRITVIRDRENVALFFDAMYDSIFRGVETKQLRDLLNGNKEKMRSIETVQQTLLEDAKKQVAMINAIATSNPSTSGGGGGGATSGIDPPFSFGTTAMKMSASAAGAGDLHSQAARLLEVERSIYFIISLKYRMRLKFYQAPFVDLEEMQTMYQMGALAPLEVVNIMRQHAGLDPIDEEVMEKNNKDRLGLVAAQTIAETPPKEPTSK